MEAAVPLLLVLRLRLHLLPGILVVVVVLLLLLVTCLLFLRLLHRP